MGLSPRVRGSLASGVDDGQMEGSIPACAGEPAVRGRRLGVLRVYPRVCGGATGMTPHPRLVLGLSPRVRGSRRPRSRPTSLEGSIPACAGEPLSKHSQCSFHGVYPRVCGGAIKQAFTVQFSWGLSPRVRGSLQHPDVRPMPFGSIPACAGEPCIPGRPPMFAGVYPRVCGGACAGVPIAPSYPGLSPRVRGSRLNEITRRPLLGSIPACAGEPSWCPVLLRPHWVYPRVCGGALPTHTSPSCQ